MDSASGLLKLHLSVKKKKKALPTTLQIHNPKDE